MGTKKEVLPGADYWLSDPDLVEQESEQTPPSSSNREEGLVWVDEDKADWARSTIQSYRKNVVQYVHWTYQSSSNPLPHPPRVLWSETYWYKRAVGILQRSGLMESGGHLVHLSSEELKSINGFVSLVQFLGHTESEDDDRDTIYKVAREISERGSYRVWWD